MNLTWFGALSIGVAADVFVAIGLVLFVRADRKYQAEKRARLQAMGLYGPEFVYVMSQDIPDASNPQFGFVRGFRTARVW